MKKRILFVDDQPALLAGLKRLLRSKSDQWDMHFVDDGESALELMNQSPFDVVVSDFSMPGMNGAELLKMVQEIHPKTIRFILSGNSDQKTLIQGMNSMHQFISKPCQPKTIIELLSNALELRDTLENEDLKQLLTKIDTLPSLPSLYNNLTNEMKSSEFSLARAGEIISKDLGFSSKIMQIANSPYFGLQTPVADPYHAVQVLGMETVQTLVISSHVFSSSELSGAQLSLMEDLWEHSLKAGNICRKLARLDRLENSLVEQSLLTGMLHDIGELILFSNFPSQFQQVQTLINTDGLSQCEAERQVFQVSHAEIGAYLLGLWGLPEPVIEAIAFHHTPGNSKNESQILLPIIHLVDGMIQNGMDTEEPPNNKFLDLEYLEKHNMMENLSELKEIFIACREN